MDVKYLGSGHAYETPNSDCGCDTCYTQRESDDARNLRTNVSLGVKAGDSYLLVDAGQFEHQKPRLRSFMGLPEGTSIADKLSGLLITHSHADHVKGLPDFDSVVREGIGSAIPTYAHEACYGRLSNMDFDFLFKFGTLDKKVLEMDNTYDIGEFHVRPFKVDHQSPIAPGAVGYVIDHDDKRLVYTGDFATMDDLAVVTEDGKQPNLLITETNWFNQLEDRKDHMSFQQVLPYVKAWQPEKLQLTHLGSDDELTTESDAHLGFKKRAVDPLLKDHVPRSHEEWDAAVREVLANDPELRRFADQENLISYDRLTVSV